MVISSETDEALDLADRILVFRAGTLVLDCPRKEIDREQLMAAMLHGGSPVEHVQAQPAGEA